MISGKTNISKGLFFLGKEISRSSSIIVNMVKIYLSFILGTFGIVRIKSGDDIISFSIYVDQNGLLRFSNDSMAIDSDINFIHVIKGDYLRLPKSKWDDKTYSAYVSYSHSPYESGMVKISKIDNTHGVVEWDQNGGIPDFTVINMESAPKYMVGFKRADGNDTINDQSYYVTSIYDGKMYIEGSSIQDEYTLRFKVVGSFNGQRYSTSESYAFDSHKFNFYEADSDGNIVDKTVTPVGFKIADISSSSTGIHKIVRGINDFEATFAAISKDVTYYLDSQNLNVDEYNIAHTVNTMRYLSVNSSYIFPSNYPHGKKGDVVISNDFIYFCLEAGNWKRVATEEIV